MIYVFKTRYSGWPAPGEWVAAIEREDVAWQEPYVECLIDDVVGAGDCDASDASKELRRRCHLFGADTPHEALTGIMQFCGLVW